MFDQVMMLNLCIFSFLLMIITYKFMLMILMVMEIVVLFISMMIYFFFSLVILESYAIYYMIFSVCESVLGLMLLVLIIRFHGNDMYMFMNLSKFI